MKTPKFIIGDNPLVEGSGIYIIHTREPVFIAEIHEHENEQKQSDFHNKIWEFQKKAGTSVLVGRGIKEGYLFTLVCVGHIHTDKTADELAKLMRRMSDWYLAYLKWEENNVDQE